MNRVEAQEHLIRVMAPGQPLQYTVEGILYTVALAHSTRLTREARYTIRAQRPGDLHHFSETHPMTAGEAARHLVAVMEGTRREFALPVPAPASPEVNWLTRNMGMDRLQAEAVCHFTGGRMQDRPPSGAEAEAWFREKFGLSPEAARLAAADYLRKAA